jgi:hypothetical protein
MSLTQSDSIGPAFIVNTMCGKVCITLFSLRVSFLSFSPDTNSIASKPWQWGDIGPQKAEAPQKKFNPLQMKFICFI